jgi:hypothetical protein
MLRITRGIAGSDGDYDFKVTWAGEISDPIILHGNWGERI